MAASLPRQDDRLGVARDRRHVRLRLAKHERDQESLSFAVITCLGPNGQGESRAATAPSAPLNLVASASASSVTLTWSAPSSGDTVAS